MNFDEIYKLKYVDLKVNYDHLQIIDEPKRGTFLWVLEQAEAGKTTTRVTQNSSNDRVFLTAEKTMDGCRVDIKGVYWLTTEDYKATDWEIYCEKKTLFQKTGSGVFVNSLDIKDVRAALKELYEFIGDYKFKDLKKDSLGSMGLFQEKIEEIFGEELL
jgi:hypothetical protein